MNHIQILKRAWGTLWSYKTLWVFGVLIALTTVEAYNGGNSGTRGSITPEMESWRPTTSEEIRNLPDDLREAVYELEREFEAWKPTEKQIVDTILTVAAVLICLVLLWLVVAAVVSYVSRTALIRMVDRYEGSGEKVDWRTGFRLGWSRPAFRLFLIDLLIFLAMSVGVILLLAAAASPLLLSLVIGGLALIPGAVMTAGMMMLLFFAVLVASALAAMAREVFYRECVLGGKGVLDSLRDGVAVLRANLADVFLLWLLLLAVQIIFAVALIPVAILLFGLGLALGLGIGALLFLILKAGSVLTAILAAVIVGFVVLFLVVGFPMLFLRGLKETYLSTAWTMGYREIPVRASGEQPA
ncbi:MAG: hypothetical protein JW929_05220 [Anaerolineales bacterium]|nr:hypothetical protein [Anaerolineales bacterium]